MDRIEIIYNAIDQMADAHGKPRPEEFGGGKWNFDEEIKIWKKGIIKGERVLGREPLSQLQWKVINFYIEEKRNK